jgi:hypothetical protein
MQIDKQLAILAMFVELPLRYLGKWVGVCGSCVAYEISTYFMALVQGMCYKM